MKSKINYSTEELEEIFNSLLVGDDAEGILGTASEQKARRLTTTVRLNRQLKDFYVNAAKNVGVSMQGMITLALQGFVNLKIQGQKAVNRLNTESDADGCNLKKKNGEAEVRRQDNEIEVLLNTDPHTKVSDGIYPLYVGERWSDRNILKKLTQAELTEVIDKHKLWIKKQEEGAKADFECIDLEGVDFSGVNLRCCNFKCAKLINVNFSGADLEGANFVYAEMEGANFQGAGLTDADFAHSWLEGANLKKAVIIRGDFYKADCTGVNFSGADLEGAIFIETKLAHALLSGANLDNIDIRGECRFELAYIEELEKYRTNHRTDK